MMGFDDIAARIDTAADADALVAMGERVLEHWVAARGEAPTDEEHEGFRLLALHRQGAKGDPSFNACRETCRELVYRRNLIDAGLSAAEAESQLTLARLVARHLYLFVRGKMEQAALGEFCCAARPARAAGA